MKRYEGKTAAGERSGRKKTMGLTNGRTDALKMDIIAAPCQIVLSFGHTAVTTLSASMQHTIY
jgi:hypothetical protein